LSKLPTGATVDLSKWSYAQLRDTINTSTDVELLQACRNEFQKRFVIIYLFFSFFEKKNEIKLN